VFPSGSDDDADNFLGNELREVPDFHTEIESKMKMNW
jgi:proteasome maturation protein